MSGSGRPIPQDRVLVVGLGRMGFLRFQRLKEVGVEVEGLDPKPAAGLAKEPAIHTAPIADLNLARFSHIFVSTPIGYHFPIYEEIRNKGFSGPVLVEKPLCIRPSEYDAMRNDTKLHLGLTERFNPRVPWNTLGVNSAQIVSLDFVRTSASPEATTGVSIFEDLALHDLHLAYLLLNQRFGEEWQLSEDSEGNSASLQTKTERGTLLRFLWSRSTFQKERKIVVRSDRGTELFDLVHTGADSVRRISGRPRPEMICSPDPVSAEMCHFLRGDLPRDWLSPHDFFMDVLRSGKRK